jgi:MYXO-CTERM domain-containing protein
MQRQVFGPSVSNHSIAANLEDHGVSVLVTSMSTPSISMQTATLHAPARLGHGSHLLAGACSLVALLLASTPARASGPPAGDMAILAGCGDGVIDAGEQCDDGNAVANDGCSASCKEEVGYDCVRADFSRLDDDHIPVVSDKPIPPTWEMKDASTVTQTKLGTDPAVYITNLPATNAGEIEFQVDVAANAQNEDYFGIVLGYNPDELSRPDAKYLLIDWHGESNAQGSGLTLSLVRGPTNAYDLSAHTGTVTSLLPNDLSPSPGADKYWRKGQLYIWRLRYTETRITLTIELDSQQVFSVDLQAANVPNLEAFPTGNLGFYVYEQDQVKYNLLSPKGSSICVFDDGDGLRGGGDQDEDNDGIPDALENIENLDPDDDSDHDGVPNYLDADDRGDENPAGCDEQHDNICDTPGPLFDVDEDGKPNHLDLDADGDAIPDIIESGHDGSDDDKDGFLDGPAGTNGIPNQVESMPDSGVVNAPRDTDGDHFPDFLDPDSDDDGELDRNDNCRIIANPGQENHHGGAPGDACDDSDDDGRLDLDDNCPTTKNPGQENNHGDSAGDACDDSDDDGHVDLEDNCPTTKNPGQENNYGDARAGDACDDSDDDGQVDLDDNCPITKNPGQENNHGGARAGDACDDSDDDGHVDLEDNCPATPNPDQEDWDGNGVGNTCDPITVSGSGCSSTDGSGAGALLLVVLALALIPRRRRRGVLASCLVASALWTVPAARAQDMPDHFPVERFRLAVDDAGLLGVEWAAVPRHLHWDVALWLGAADEPLVLRREGDDRPFSELVSSQIAGSLIGGVSLWNRVQLGLELPLVMYQSSSEMLPPGFHEAGGFGLGDIRILPKVQLLRADRHGVHLALIPSLTLPTGDSESYRGEPGVTLAPELVVSRALGALRLSGNLGYRARQDTRMVDLVVEDELFVHLGAGYRFDGGGEGLPLEIDLALSGATAATSPLRNANQNHLELLTGASYRVAGPVVGILAGGLGVQEGFGTPDWRAVIGVRLSPPPEPDRDRDRIPDATDRCPLVPEDRDTFEDRDGCPDEDNDGDGVPDASDGAPDAPEDMDQHADGDGVPDPDNDGDSLLDADDKCPLEAETANTFEDDDGCPDDIRDMDRDRVLGEADQCPHAAEDVDGIVDGDGCPEVDSDRDGLVDEQDGCATESGPIENRGCPDTDADGDEIVDRLDNCPAKPGSRKNQGCPTQQRVRLAGDRIELLGKVHFKNNDHRILRNSHALLRNLAEVLQAHPEIERVRIEGHTDDRGNDAHNLALSQRRAEAVVAFLLGQGVAPSRVTARGYGETRPIANNATAAGRATNRRVETHILGPQDDTTQSRD